MEAIMIQLQPWFQWLSRSTLQVSLLVCIVLLVKIVLGTRLAPRWHYCLWLLVIVRMLMPAAPQSSLSVFNLIPDPLERAKPTAAVAQVETVQAIEIDETPIANAVETGLPPVQEIPVQETPPAVAAAPAAAPVTEQAGKPFTFPPLSEVLPFIWLGGAVLLAIYVFAGTFRLWSIVEVKRPVTDSAVLNLLEDCKAQMNIHTPLVVVETDKVASPALFGFLRPRLLLPEGLLGALERSQLRHILLHELAHLKRGDIYLGWLVAILQTVHWFNPLVWFGFNRMRSDRELACDDLAMSAMGVDEPAEYGRTIVKLLEDFSRPQYAPSLAGILEERSQLKRRITMITKFKKGSYRFSLLAAIVMILLSAVALTNAKDSTPLQEKKVKASAFVDLLINEKFDEAVENFDKKMTGAMPSKRLAEVWKATVGQAGPFEKKLGTRADKYLWIDIIYVTCQFESGPMDIKVVYDRNAKINGLWFVPVPQNVLEKYANQTKTKVSNPFSSPIAAETLIPQNMLGTWQGMATDKPEDGSSEDQLQLHLLYRDNNLIGNITGKFARDNYSDLRNLKIDGDTISFRVDHNIENLQMEVTLKLVDGQLRGEGIPINFNEDRCDIVLTKLTSGNISSTGPQWIDVTNATGPKGYALKFNGTGDFVRVPDHPSLEPKSEITIEMWAWIDGVQSTFTRLLRKAGYGAAGYLFAADQIDRRMQIRLDDGLSTIRAVDNVLHTERAGKWHHFAGVYGDEYVAFYVDGKLVDKQKHPQKDLMHSDIDLYIGHGAPGGASEYFKGMIDEVRIWNIARTEDQIRTNMTRSVAADSEGLVAYWNFDEGKGSIAHDSSGNKNHGKLEYQELEQPIHYKNISHNYLIESEMITKPAEPAAENLQAYLGVWEMVEVKGEKMKEMQLTFTPGGTMVVEYTEEDGKLKIDTMDFVFENGKLVFEEDHLFVYLENNRLILIANDTKYIFEKKAPANADAGTKKLTGAEKGELFSAFMTIGTTCEHIGTMLYDDKVDLNNSLQYDVILQLCKPITEIWPKMLPIAKDTEFEPVSIAGANQFDMFYKAVQDKNTELAKTSLRSLQQLGTNSSEMFMNLMTPAKEEKPGSMSAAVARAKAKADESKAAEKARAITERAKAAADARAKAAAEAAAEKAKAAASEKSPANDKAEMLPGKLVFHGRYRHRSRGRDIDVPGELWVKQDSDGAINVLSHLPWMDSFDSACGSADHRLKSYLSESGPGYRMHLDFSKNSETAMLTRKGVREDKNLAEMAVPKGARFSPNSRPDSYSAANIFFRWLNLSEGQSKELTVCDWDNSGEKLVDYNIKVTHTGKESVTVPAGTFQANHYVLQQLTSADTWFKKRAGHITDFWILDNNVIVRVLRHREPYEMVLLDYRYPEDLGGKKNVEIANTSSVESTDAISQVKTDRGVIKVLQTPSPENEFSLILRFDDNSYGGAGWYDANITITPAESETQETLNIRIKAYIDGISDLVLKGNTVYWHNRKWAVPGRHGNNNYPTTINSVEWIPAWSQESGTPRGEQKSNVLKNLPFTLPARKTDVKFEAKKPVVTVTIPAVTIPAGASQRVSNALQVIWNGMLVVEREMAGKKDYAKMAVYFEPKNLI